jgi:hypothetical protein
MTRQRCRCPILLRRYLVYCELKTRADFFLSVVRADKCTPVVFMHIVVHILLLWKAVIFYLYSFQHKEEIYRNQGATNCHIYAKKYLTTKNITYRIYFNV